MPLTEGSIEELFKNGAIVIDFKELLGDVILESVEVFDEYLKFVILPNFHKFLEDVEMIQAKDISLQYADGTMGLYNSDFTVKAGEFIYIVGPSGSGKTSLLKLLMGIEFPSTGSLYVMGQAIRKRELKKIRNMRRHIGPIFQEFKLIQGRTAYENVIMGMRF